MPDFFTKLFRQHQEAIIRRLVDEIYREPRTELPEMLPVGQLVENYPEILAQLAHLLDKRAGEGEIAEVVRHLRDYAQVRFHGGVLIDEVARELMLLRKTLNDFLWREERNAAQGDTRDLQDALECANRFVDEMIAQAVVIYAASWRPPAETRTSVWPPPRRRKTDFPESDHDR